jgi:cob(I)alamin adenosyltransferase
MVSLSSKEAVSPLALAYVNRLSDLLFVIARVLARRSGEEILWRKQRSKPVPR